MATVLLICETTLSMTKLEKQPYAFLLFLEYRLKAEIRNSDQSQGIKNKESDKQGPIRGRIGCLGRVSISCGDVTSVVDPVYRSDN